MLIRIAIICPERLRFAFVGPQSVFLVLEPMTRQVKSSKVVTVSFLSVTKPLLHLESRAQYTELCCLVTLTLSRGTRRWVESVSATRGQYWTNDSSTQNWKRKGGLDLVLSRSLERDSIAANILALKMYSLPDELKLAQGI